MFSPECGLFTKCKNEQWKFVKDNILQVLSKAAVDAMDEKFTWHCAALQEQLEEAQESLAAEDDNNENDEDDPELGLVLPLPHRVDSGGQEQNPDLASRVIIEDAGRNIS